MSTAWTTVRRPLLFLFAMGLLLSLLSSPRISVRTVVDGMISFAFVPVSEAIALGLVYLSGERPLPFSRAFDGYLASHRPWLLWILACGVWQALLVPATMSQTMSTTLLVSLLVPAVWAAWLDLQYFRVVLGRRHSERDLVIARFVGWTGALGYFFGIAGWAQIVAW